MLRLLTTTPGIYKFNTVQLWVQEFREGVEYCFHDGYTNYAPNKTSHEILLSKCLELRRFVNEWSENVFRGKIQVKPQVEQLLKETVDWLANTVNRFFFETGHLSLRRSDPHNVEIQDKLKDQAIKLQNLCLYWPTPTLSVSPGPRVTLSEVAIEGGKGFIAQLRAKKAGKSQ